MASADQPRMLLIDSARSESLLAISAGERVLAERREQGRRFSAEWPTMLSSVLDGTSLHLKDLDAIAVVNGPGSFTGVRVGLAAAIGLAEASGLPIVALSALEVMQGMCAEPCVAVMEAGNGQWFVRDRLGWEALVEAEVLGAMARREIVAVDANSASKLPHNMQARASGSTSQHLALVAHTHWRQGRLLDASTVAANYMRSEQQIYGRRERIP